MCSSDLISGTSVAQAETEFSGKGYGDFKNAVAEVVIEFLKPIQSKAQELINDPIYLTEVMQKGAEKANAVAEKTLKDVYNAIGIVPRA